MKILKLLSKEILSIFFILYFIFTASLKAEEEAVDIWKLEKKIDENSSIGVSNIVDDPNETKNIASLHPQIVQEMEKILQKITSDSKGYNSTSNTKDESKKIEAELRKLDFL